MGWIKHFGWCALFLCGLALAEPVTPEPMAMTPDAIERWLEAAPAVYRWSQQHPQADAKVEITDITQLAEVFSQRVASSGADSEELSRLLHQYGFSSYQQWSEMFERLILAVSALHLQANKISDSLREAMEQLANDKDIAEQTRDGLLQEYQAMLSTIAVLEAVPASELQVVAPYEPRIRAWLDSAR